MEGKDLDMPFQFVVEVLRDEISKFDDFLEVVEDRVLMAEDIQCENETIGLEGLGFAVLDIFNKEVVVDVFLDDDQFLEALHHQQDRADCSLGLQPPLFLDLVLRRNALLQTLVVQNEFLVLVLDNQLLNELTAVQHLHGGEETHFDDAVVPLVLAEEQFVEDLDDVLADEQAQELDQLARVVEVLDVVPEDVDADVVQNGKQSEPVARQ